MKPIGGFFELEVPQLGRSPHPRALALSTGRACLMVMLDVLKPEVVHLPFHTCDATLEPFHRVGVPYRFYSLKEDLSPSTLPRLSQGEYFLWTNYYGVCDIVTERLKSKYGKQLLIDDTHAFFRDGHEGYWSFTSARKYFGVPDGAYLYAPVALDIDAPRFTGYSITHLVLRSLGQQEEAYRAYVAYEKSLGSEIARISDLSEILLRGVDYVSVKSIRRQNFEYLHGALGSKNTLLFDYSATTVPFCYPFLPTMEVDRQKMYAKGLFVPELWPDVYTRKIAGFEFERQISKHLLPLPVDHRYTPADLRRLVEYLMHV